MIDVSKVGRSADCLPHKSGHPTRQIGLHAAKTAIRVTKTALSGGKTARSCVLASPRGTMACTRGREGAGGAKVDFTQRHSGERTARIHWTRCCQRLKTDRDKTDQRHNPFNGPEKA